MRRPPPFVASCVWGSVCGAALGAARTRAAALHLLAKGRALEAVGIPSLPGPSQWDALASWPPAGAGALFFGLSLGLGAGALAALWVAAARGTGGRGVGAPAWAVLLGPLWAGVAGDWGLAGMLALASLGALVSAVGAEPATGRPLALRLACATVAALGLVPWLLAPEGAFTRLRDRWLLEGPGAGVDEFYYRWTLYPAEALKSLAARSQPVADLSALAPSMAHAFAAEALPLRVLGVVAPGEGADFSVEAREGPARLVSGSTRVAWPVDAGERRREWDRFCRQADASGPLRSATAIALFFGCPLGLTWALGAGCAGAASRWAPGRPAAALALAGALAVGLALAGRPRADEGMVQRLREAPAAATVREALSSRSPTLRLYGARAAAALGPALTAPLTTALKDPVINVRYAAAESLGATGGGAAERTLVALLRGPEEWYVKERAYAALWRLGWRPPIPPGP